MNYSITKRERFMLEDLETNGHQSSWDWEADYRFAYEFFPEYSYLLREMCYSGAVAGVRMSAHDRIKFIQRARLKTLRGLVKKGLVRAEWAGTGEGGQSFFGITRVRVYHLADGRGL